MEMLISLVVALVAISLLWKLTKGVVKLIGVLLVFGGIGWWYVANGGGV